MAQTVSTKSFQSWLKYDVWMVRFRRVLFTVSGWIIFWSVLSENLKLDKEASGISLAVLFATLLCLGLRIEQQRRPVFTKHLTNKEWLVGVTVLLVVTCVPLLWREFKFDLMQLGALCLFLAIVVEERRAWLWSKLWSESEKSQHRQALQ